MRLLLLADGEVGLSITKYITTQFPEDVGHLVAIGDSAVYKYALSHGWKVFDSIEATSVEDSKPVFDLGILAWWPHKLSEEELAFAQNGFINTHPSLLPWGKGKHPTFWALKDEEPYGVSIHLATRALDAGPVLFQDKIPYDWTETGGSLYERAARALTNLFERSYPAIRSLDWSFLPSSGSKGSFHLAKELSRASVLNLEESMTAKEFLNLLRAKTFPGAPGCRFLGDDGNWYNIQISITKEI